MNVCGIHLAGIRHLLRARFRTWQFDSKSTQHRRGRVCLISLFTSIIYRSRLEEMKYLCFNYMDVLYYLSISIFQHTYAIFMLADGSSLVKKFDVAITFMDTPGPWFLYLQKISCCYKKTGEGPSGYTDLRDPPSSRLPLESSLYWRF